MGKKTVLIGATTNKNRYANIAAKRLMAAGHDLKLIGIREGKINDNPIITTKQEFTDVHTVTLYIGPHRQAEYYDYILFLKPKRIIFNPGTENPGLFELATENGIACIEYCTLMMLDSNDY